jgi:hypothetical protein
MIIVDESLQNRKLIAEIATWYKGQVVSVLSLRPTTLIHDDGITTLLQQVHQPTFVTINVADFWLKVQANPAFCIVAISFPQSESQRVPLVLRDVLKRPEFRTKSSRMGKIIHVMPTYIQYYEADRQVRTIR